MDNTNPDLMRTGRVVMVNHFVPLKLSVGQDCCEDQTA